MASRRGEKTVRTGTKLRLPFSVIEHLRGLKSGQNVSLHYTDSQAGQSTIQATVTTDFLEININKDEGGSSTSGVGTGPQSADAPRRSSRQRKTKSALELLGKKREGEQTAVTATRKTGSPSGKISDKLTKSDAESGRKNSLPHEKKKDIAAGNAVVEVTESPESEQLKGPESSTWAEYKQQEIDDSKTNPGSNNVAEALTCKRSARSGKSVDTQSTPEVLTRARRANSSSTSLPLETTEFLHPRTCRASKEPAVKSLGKGDSKTKDVQEMSSGGHSFRTQRASESLDLTDTPSTRSTRSQRNGHDVTKLTSQSGTDGWKCIKPSPGTKKIVSQDGHLPSTESTGNTRKTRSSTQRDAESVPSTRRGTKRIFVQQSPDRLSRYKKKVDQETTELAKNDGAKRTKTVEDTDDGQGVGLKAVCKNASTGVETSAGDNVIDTVQGYENTVNRLDSKTKISILDVSSPVVEEIIYNPGTIHVATSSGFGEGKKRIVLTTGQQQKQATYEQAPDSETELPPGGEEGEDDTQIIEISPKLASKVDGSDFMVTDGDQNEESEDVAAARIQEAASALNTLAQGGLQAGTLVQDRAAGDETSMMSTVSVINTQVESAVKEKTVISESSSELVKQAMQNAGLFTLQSTPRGRGSGRGRGRGRGQGRGRGSKCQNRSGMKYLDDDNNWAPVIVSDSLRELMEQVDPVDKPENHLNIQRNVEGKRVAMTCKHCDKLLLNMHDFARHIRKHKEVKYQPWKCPLCDYKASIRAQLARHMNVHSDTKPYVCKECGKGFTFKQKLQIHMKYHLDIRDHTCAVCGLAFHEFKTLKTHLNRLHGKTIKAGTWELNDLEEDQIVEPESGCQISSAQFLPTSSADGLPGSTTETSSAGNDQEMVKGGTMAQEEPQREERIPTSSTDVIPATAPLKLAEAPLRGKRGIGRFQRRPHIYGTKKTEHYTQLFKHSFNKEMMPDKDRLEPFLYLKLGLTPTLKKSRNKDSESDDMPRVKTITNQRVIRHDQLEAELQEHCMVVQGLNKVEFVCNICQGTYPSKTQFVKHLEQEHPDIKAWKCNECEYRCRMRTSLIVHQKLHLGIRDHVCKICNKGFTFKQKLTNHMKHHANLRDHKCPDCGKGFNEKSDLTKHIKRVHIGERPFRCELCSKAYKDKVQLKRHMDGHSGIKQHLCEYCNKYYKSRMSLMQHMKSHTCMFHCEICDKNFGSYSGFMAHKVMHDESYEGFKCNVCDKTLHTKGSLHRHKLVAHTNERPFSCDQCTKCFKTKKDLKNHSLIHSGRKDFRCEVCDFACARMESLRVHMRRHAHIKPFQCGVCNKEYTQKHALETHLRHHTGEIEGQCHVCLKTFYSKYQLDQHIRRKHGSKENPKEGEEDPNTTTALTVFMCEECNSVFLSQDSLAVHILAEHMKQGWAGSLGVRVPTEGQESSPDQDQTISKGASLSLECEDGEVIAEASLHHASSGQPEIETLVAITDPTSMQEKLVSVIHPQVMENIGSTVGIPVTTTGGQYVALTDPDTLQERQVNIADLGIHMDEEESATMTLNQDLQTLVAVAETVEVEVPSTIEVEVPLVEETIECETQS